MSRSAYSPCFLEYSNNRAHAFAAFLTIACANTRFTTKMRGERDPTSRSEDKENFFLVSPMVRMLRLSSVSDDGVINGHWGPSLKVFPRREYEPREMAVGRVELGRNCGLKLRILWTKLCCAELICGGQWHEVKMAPKRYMYTKWQRWWYE